MGDLMRRYWIPGLLSTEVPQPDSPPVRIRLLGEDLVMFRDSNGAVVSECELMLRLMDQ